MRIAVELPDKALVKFNEPIGYIEWEKGESYETLTHKAINKLADIVAGMQEK